MGSQERVCAWTIRATVLFKMLIYMLKWWLKWTTTYSHSHWSKSLFGPNLDFMLNAGIFMEICCWFGMRNEYMHENISLIFEMTLIVFKKIGTSFAAICLFEPNLLEFQWLFLRTEWLTLCLCQPTESFIKFDFLFAQFSLWTTSGCVFVYKVLVCVKLLYNKID